MARIAGSSPHLKCDESHRPTVADLPVEVRRLVVEFLFKHDDPETFVRSASLGLGLLVRKGLLTIEDPNVRDTEGKTALTAAVAKSSLASVQLLLNDQRVDPNTLCNEGFTTLWYAVASVITARTSRVVATTRLVIMRRLLNDQRVDPNIICNGTTALMAAVTGNPSSPYVFEAVKMLLDDPQVVLDRQSRAYVIVGTLGRSQPRS